MGDVVSISTGSKRMGMRRGTSAMEHYERGCAREAAGDAAGAVAAYERALAGRPDLADAHCNLGRLLHDRGDLQGAEAHYRLAVCAADDVPLYWFHLGVAAEDQGRRAEAVASYERALGLDDGCADAHFNLARLCEQLGRTQGDELWMRRAVRHLLRYRQLRGAAAR
jgi:tetratricopeptide (TPR) repeat protein